MVTISLCMIVKNEEDAIARCLDSVKQLVDEIIIVDTGSTDQTKAIVSRYTDKVYDFEWIDDFAAARNYAFSLAGKNYILWLDADDVLKPEDQDKLQELKRTLSMDVDSVTMKYHLAFDAEGNVTAMLRRNRLVKRSKGFRWYGAVHEYLQVGGHIIDSDVAVTHLGDHRESDRNLNIYEKRLAKGEQFSPRDLYYYANELKDHGRFSDALIYYRKFLDTKAGWIEDVVAACGKMADCYHNLGDEEKELEMTFLSFLYDTPRAEACCRIGFRFLQKQDWRKAVFWYELATNTPEPASSWGMTNTSCRTWLPHLQLCVCYDRMGQHEKAYHHNELARGFRPQHPSILYNKTYLEGILAKTAKQE
ncbi:glycosyltransferase family 2 protein [Paenibacillus rigui]|uniref:glycosyltransferase family 2 protein n=1 Tax=Paenibacillus rigui TaxID=554312 RepID=UPI001FE9F307|nr:glycosyltransferase family 2 protein [Paenibacillus rigui]